MSNNIVYYLQIPADYFRHNLKFRKLKKMGADYALFYQSMLSESLERKGYIDVSNGIESYADYQLINYDEDPCIVIETIEACLNIGLIEVRDNSLYFYQAEEFCRSETKAASRMRRKRARDNGCAIKLERNNVTHSENNSIKEEKRKELAQNLAELKSKYVIPDRNYVTDKRNNVTPLTTSYIFSINNINKSKDINKLIRERDKKEKKVTPEKIMEIYHNRCPSLPKCRKLTDQIRGCIYKLQDSYSLEDFKKVFDYAENNDFLKGKCNGAGHENWKAGFKFLIRPDKFANVLAGYYDKWVAKPKNIMDFCSFEQRSYNLDEMEALLLEH